MSVTRAGTAALRTFLAEPPLRLPADAAPSRPYRLHAAKWRIYISIRSPFDPGRRIRPSLETLITAGLIGARRGWIMRRRPNRLIIVGTVRDLRNNRTIYRDPSEQLCGDYVCTLGLGK